MFSQYFGHYLLSKGLVNPAQLNEALDYQSSVHLKLGVLAVNSGYMTAEQVKSVHEKQSRVDKKFGELATEMNYLDEEQLNLLLATQKQGHLLLGQALIDKGYMKLEDLQTALEEYKKDHNLTERQFNVIQQNDIDEIVNTFFNFGETLWCKVYADYTALIIRNFIRFIDDNPRVEVSRLEKGYFAKWFIFQEIYGNINIYTGIAAGDREFLEIAARFSDEKFETIDELAKSSVSEFLNTQNGIFLVNMSNNGIELDMRPQNLCENETLGASKKGFKISFYLSWGNFDVIIL